MTSTYRLLLVGLFLVVSGCTTMNSTMSAGQDADRGGTVYAEKVGLSVPGGLVASGDEYHPYPPYYRPDD